MFETYHRDLSDALDKKFWIRNPESSPKSYRLVSGARATRTKKFIKIRS